MKNRLLLVIAPVFLILALALAACAPQGPCSFTANDDVTAYRLPDAGSDVFGTLPAGESFEALARTADGWIGFDPGVAQAGNIGLARHRWLLPNVSVSPSCLDSVDLVTLADVQADVNASNQ